MSAEDILVVLKKHNRKWMTSKQLAAEAGISHQSAINCLRGLRKGGRLYYKEEANGSIKYQHKANGIY
jgi:DNA-binding IscR family transcriptional regulator